jgi:hypothetical protein
MPNPSADARQKNPSRRAVLKVGANAAWAVPAIQIAAATPAFAGSTDATLTPTVLNTSQSGNTLTITVQVKSTNRAATGVSVSASGADVVPGSFTVSPATAPVALNGTANFTVKVNTTGNGVVTLTPAGTTANANKNALATATVVYAKAQLAVTSGGYIRTTADDYIFATVSTTAAAAKSVTVGVSGYGGSTSVTVGNLKPGTSVPLTIPVQMVNGSHPTTLIKVNGTTDNNTTAAGANAPAAEVQATVNVTGDNPANTSSTALLSVSVTGTNRGKRTVSFTVSADKDVNNVAYTITSANGTVAAAGSVGNLVANRFGVRSINMNGVGVNGTGNFTVKVSVNGTGSSGYPLAIPATDTATV